MSSNTTPSIVQLQRALAIATKIESLQAELDSLVANKAGSSSPAAVLISTVPRKGRGGKRTMSPEAREKIAAAARARWAKQKGTSVAAKVAKPGKKKGGLSAEGRARLAAAMKARWDAARKGTGPAPTGAKVKAKKAEKVKAAKKGKRTLSPEVRAKMAEAARKRWAAKKA